LLDIMANSLLNAVLPAYVAREIHEVAVRGSGGQVFDALRRLDFSRSPVVRGLFALRGIPVASLRMEDLSRMGFVLLEEDPGKEIVLGLVGKFWRPAGTLVGVSPAEFAGYDRPGYAKAAWNFSVRPSAPGSVVLSTETRIACTDGRSRRRFKGYWLFIRPFSGWIRKEILMRVKREVEFESALLSGAGKGRQKDG
jgi:hypothetical protein